MWKYTVWYYNQRDVVYVPSEATGDELCRKGVQKDKIRLYPRGIDAKRFHPSKRNGFFKSRYGFKGDEIKLLYVGRVSKEKNMPLLSAIYRSLVDDPAQREKMRFQAREYMQNRSFEAAFLQLWESYRSLNSGDQQHL